LRKARDRDRVLRSRLGGLYACGAFARHRSLLDLRPEENGALTEGTASHSTGHRVKRFDYLFRFSKDPNVTVAKMRPAALSASVRTMARDTPSVRAILLSTIANIAAHSVAKTASSNRSIRKTVARGARPGLPAVSGAPRPADRLKRPADHQQLPISMNSLLFRELDHRTGLKT
jgi:hypothetical protein